MSSSESVLNTVETYRWINNHIWIFVEKKCEKAVDNSEYKYMFYDLPHAKKMFKQFGYSESLAVSSTYRALSQMYRNKKYQGYRRYR